MLKTMVGSQLRMAGLSLGGLPLVSKWLSQDMEGAAEEFRKAAVHIVAIVIGAILAYVTKDQAPATLPFLKTGGPAIYLVFGAMAAGGSGLWNSALDILRETSKQKKALTDSLPGKPAPAPVTTAARV